MRERRRHPLIRIRVDYDLAFYAENGVQSVRPEPFGKLRTGQSKGRSWFDKLTTNGI